MYQQTERHLLAYFGEDRPLDEIAPADADKWRQYLKEHGLASTTISKRIKCARQAFRRAVKWRMIHENPFADVVAGSQSNRNRQHFVTQDDTEKLIAACPDAEWRLIVALSRYGGVRCPSETLALTWDCIDWERGRIRVPSSKTEHLEGGHCRIMPLFHELVPYLQEVFDATEPGTSYLITRYRKRSCNLRTQLGRIIRRAGLEPWPRPFHNLRASRQTELVEQYPLHVVCAWLGNSRAVAQEHYLQVTDAHYARAIQVPTGQAAQKTAQYLHARGRMTTHDTQPTPCFHAKNGDMPGGANRCEKEDKGGMVPTGFERLPKTPIKLHVGEAGGAKSGAASATKATPSPAPTTAMPDDLVDVVHAWPTLPPAIRASILAMIQAAKGGER